MLNYKECSIEAFNAAMKEQNNDVKNISDANLYILYTKFKADALTCFRVGTSYSSDLGISSENRAKAYKVELQNRGIDVL
ncbi:MAG: hypothetical protein ACI4KR_09165 [Ruminiclostridium sp.]